MHLPINIVLSNHISQEVGGFNKQRDNAAEHSVHPTAGTRRQIWESVQGVCPANRLVLLPPAAGNASRWAAGRKRQEMLISAHENTGGRSSISTF